MYLNVNLTPPSSSGGNAEGSCAHTPKTPEILNSLISLSTSPMPSFTNYQSQVGSDLLSPTSSASPIEEKYSNRIGIPQISPPGGSDPGGGKTRVLAKVSGVFRGIRNSFTGTPSPPVPELPSPVSTVEATKSALIKEGLKIQIKSKLLSAGLEPNELLTDQKSVKEELSDSQELTPQDAERRMRRRERNKIAATKCRNKKKEKTVTLMSESESVEDQNIRLKSEIQRLTSEKNKLEKLLDDPSHVASCRHSCGRVSHHPLVVITSPDAPEQLLSSSSAEGRVLPPHTGVSEQSTSEVVTTLSYCSSNVSSTRDSSFSSDSPSPSYVNLSPSTISPLSLPSVSPPHLTVSGAHISPHTSTHTVTPPYMSSYVDEANILSYPQSCDISTTLPSLVLPVSDPLPVSTLEPVGSSSLSTFLAPKPSKSRAQKRHQPYAMARPQRVSPYPVDGSMVSHAQDLLECKDYMYPPFTKENDILTPNAYVYPQSSNEYPVCTSNVVSKLVYATERSKLPTCLTTTTTTRCRYSPYDRSDRCHQPQQQQLQQQSEQLHLNICPTTQPLADNPQMITNEEPYLQMSCNQFISDVSPSQFYPSCTYENIL